MKDKDLAILTPEVLLRCICDDPEFISAFTACGGSMERLRADLDSYIQENIDSAREALIEVLGNYQGYKKCELILVFDAYKIKGHVREVEKFNNITIVYTKEAETADMYIERASYKLAKNNRVRVVTSDGMEQLIILGNGAIRVSAREFREEIDTAEKEIRAIIDGEVPR